MCRIELTNDLAATQTRASAVAPLATAPKQIRSYAADAKAAPTEVSSILEQRIRGVQEEAGLAETGRVLSVGYVCINEQ
jgi:F-type H+-transporting ATPase subunit alpha